MTVSTLTWLLVLTVILNPTFGEPPAPPPPNIEWNPPNVGPFGGRGHYEMAGWPDTDKLVAWTADRDGNNKTMFHVSEEVYLYVYTPRTWLDNRIWLYEYHQSKNSSGRWLFWWIEIGPGRFMFGPFYPDKYQPTGNYTWKVWLLEPDSGTYQSQVLNFTYSDVIPEFSRPTLELTYAMLLALIFLIFSAGKYGRK